MKKKIAVVSLLMLAVTLCVATPAAAQTTPPPHADNLSWAAATDQISTSFYNVYRYKGLCTDTNAVFTKLVSTAPLALAYEDGSVQVGTTYCYYVTQVQGSAESGLSNLVQGTIPGPNAPSGVKVSAR